MNPDFRAMRRLIASSRSVFVLFDLTGLTGTGPLERMTEELIAPLLTPGRSAFSLITELPAASSAVSTSLPAYRADWSAFPAPVLRARLKSTAGISRRKRKKTEEYQDLLSILAQRDPPAEEMETLRDESPNRLRLVAHMLGDVALAGSNFDVKLSGGRFCGITRHGNWLLPLRPAVSYLRVQGRTTPFRTLSSFSFEGESGTGLREELGMEGKDGGALSIEYSFCDDSPLLSVTAEITYPRFPAARMVEEYAPLTITLARSAEGRKHYPRGNGS